MVDRVGEGQYRVGGGEGKEEEGRKGEHTTTWNLSKVSVVQPTHVDHSLETVASPQGEKNPP